MSDNKPVIFISYSHKDEPDKPAEGEVQWLSFVRRYLQPAVKHGFLEIWLDRHLQAGSDWEPETERMLHACDIFVLLVSTNSMASNYIVDREIALIRSRQLGGEDVVLYPIMLTPMPKIGLEKIWDTNLRPRDGRPLSSFSDHDRAQCMAEIVDEIVDLARKIELRKSRRGEGGSSNGSEAEARKETPASKAPAKKKGPAKKRASSQPKKRGVTPAARSPLDQRAFAPDYAADRTGGIDALDIGPDVEAFAQLICLENAKPPLSIALFGSWGSGKTFFMERLLEKVDELTAVSRLSNNTSTHQIVPNVVQIRFNAWHYSDANLWASLTAEFFDQLRAGGAGKKSTATYENLVDRVGRHVRSLEADALNKSDEATDVERRLRSAEDTAAAVRIQLSSAEEKALAEAAGKALSESFEKNRAALKELGRRVYMDDLASNIEEFAKAAREAATIPGKLKLVLRVFKSGTPASWFARIGLVLLLAALVAFPFADITVLAVSIGQLQQWSFFSTGVAFLASIWKGYRLVQPVLDGASAFSKNTTDTSKRLSAELVAQEAEIAKLRRRSEIARESVLAARSNLERYGGSGNIRAPEAALRYLLHDATESIRFEEGLGIVSRARRSFEKLDEIILRARNNATNDKSEDLSTSKFSAVAVPDRVILYIDDLDRCTHKQVYEVLQAVHLLLALESFVVIVGVDIRWIDGAIANHFEADLNTNPNSDLNEAATLGDRVRVAANDAISIRRTRSLEYLEKIFQIPFWLRAINSDHDGTYSKLMKHLLIANRPPDNATGAFDAPIGPAGAIGRGDTKPDVPSSQNSEAGKALGVVQEALARVTFTEKEYNFLQSPQIGSLVGKSPRAVKRFVNIYRILRARRRSSDLARFVGDDDHPPLFPVTMVFLAIDVGQTAQSARSFRNIISTTEASTFREAVDIQLTISDDSERWFAKETGIDSLDRAIELIRTEKADQLSVAEWIALSDEVRRYSFNDPRAI